MITVENLFIDSKVKDFELTKSIMQQVSYKNLVQVDGETHPGNGLLLTVNQGAFIKPCPGQKGSVCCGYWVVEWGMGCPFECEYCIIQNYTQAGDITLFLNWSECKTEIEDLVSSNRGKPLRLGTGQFGDPLALEQIFPLNAAIISWTSGIADFTVEIKTKSDYIEPVLNATNAEHVTLAFSLNPQILIDKLEHGAASLEQRLAAAVKAAEAKGCSLAFHFDPLIPISDWRNEYNKVFQQMYEAVKNYKVSWISLGTFRFPKGFQEYVEKYHPDTGIFAEEFYPSEDGKIRYFRPFREEIYKFARSKLMKLFPQTAVYMCMETPHVWQRLLGQDFFSPDLKAMLDSKIR